MIRIQWSKSSAFLGGTCSEAKTLEQECAVGELPIDSTAEDIKGIDGLDVRAAVGRKTGDVACLPYQFQALRRHVVSTALRVGEYGLGDAQLSPQGFPRID